VGQIFHGTFDAYVATLIHHWQKNKSAKIEELKLALQTVGLGNNIQATRLNDIEVELKVSRLSHKNEADNNDLVSIADVGFGVSQTLPVLVALLTAKPGQLVYLEQPEIHLHPRAQVALAQILAAAAKRGVKVVAETHSSLLLLGVQTLIAEGELDPELVRLHWFTRGEDGTTTISSVTPDETGAFGDWPEDFADVSLKAQSRYMDAVDILWSRKKR
jgi:predicted ATPase